MISASIQLYYPFGPPSGREAEIRGVHNYDTKNLAFWKGGLRVFTVVLKYYLDL